MNRAGARAEDLCAELLRSSGLRLLERNWRCRHGEIDLIAEERGVLVFAEVRMRSRVSFGGAAESVTEAKRGRILAAARLYLTRRPEAARSSSSGAARGISGCKILLYRSKRYAIVYIGLAGSIHGNQCVLSST